MLLLVDFFPFSGFSRREIGHFSCFPSGNSKPGKCATLDMTKHSISLMNLVLLEIPKRLHHVAINILAGKSDFLCHT